MGTSLPRILLTGFDPFGGEIINPSWEAVHALHGKRLAGHLVVSAQLPTEFAASLRLLKRLEREVRPVILLGVGQAGGRRQLSLERVAINLQDARIPDNAGVQPIDEPVVAGAPAAYFSTLPRPAHGYRHARGSPPRSRYTRLNGKPWLICSNFAQPGAPSQASETIPLPQADIGTGGG
jgi:pyroglutamyl-peptidase